MRRRQFIAAFGGAAFGNLLPARAQQPKRVYRVGWIGSITPLSEQPTSLYAKAFLQGMRGLGYIEGKNLAIEWRSAEGNFARLPEIIRELVALNVDVIVSPTEVGTKAAKAVTV